jgi:O-antigen ligase
VEEARQVVTRGVEHALLRSAVADGVAASSAGELAVGRRLGQGWRYSGWLAAAAAVAGVLAATWIVLSRGSPLLALAPAIAVVGLVVILLYRQAAAYVMLGSLPFAEISVGSGVSLVRYILIAAISLWLIGAVVFEPFAALRLDRTDLKVLLWALGSVVSAVILNSQAAPELAQTYLNLVLVFYMASRMIRNPQQARGAILAITIGLALIAGLSLALPNLAGSFDVNGSVERLGPLGASGDAGINRFAGWLAVGAVLPWVALDGRRRVLTIVAKALSVAIIVALVATASKAALIAVAVGAACWVVLSGRGHRALNGMSLMTILTAGWFLLPTGVHERFAEFDQANSDAYSRFAIWDAGLKMFLAHPLFGVGVGNYATFAPSYFPQGTGYQEAQAAHSVLVGALAETGVVGTLLLLIMIGSILLEGFRMVRSDWKSPIALEGRFATTPPPAFDFSWARVTAGMMAGYIVFLTVSLSVDLQRDRFFVALAGLVHGLYRVRSRVVS